MNSQVVFDSLYLSISPPKLCMYLSSSPYTPHAPPISSSLIWPPY